jgi:hypothetical protein
VWGNPPSYTQSAIGKKPKPKKQTFPSPQVWCGTEKAHTRTKKKTDEFAIVF